MESNSFLDPSKLISQLDITPGMKVVDFGSGSGHYVLTIAQILNDSGLVTAIDVIDSALEVTRAKANSLGLKNLQTIRANLEIPGSTGLPDSSQNLVLVSNTLSQNEKKLEILKEATRVTASKGKIAIVDWQKGTGGPGPEDERRIDKETTTTLVKEFGLVLEKEIQTDHYHFGLIFKK